jgi:5,10-methylene-tetrahydrofolate dehydrogenase/methenyl tetrahydrofolate cyclohydrolase
MNRELNLRNETHYQIIIECLQTEWVDLNNQIKQNKDVDSLTNENINFLKQRKDSVIELLELLN